MRSHQTICAVTLLSAAMIAPASADGMKADVAFNNGMAEMSGNQPDDGVEVAYRVTLAGGELDGCTVDIVEAMYPREDGAWGIFDIRGDVSCDEGDFSYVSSGAWDGNGFHGAGAIDDGSGSGDFENVSGRVAQLGGGAADAGDGTLDVSYSLVFDVAED